MGLGRLLNIGKSFRLVKDQSHRYRPQTRQTWPQFETGSRLSKRKTMMKTETMTETSSPDQTALNSASAVAEGLGNGTGPGRPSAGGAPAKSGWSFRGLFSLERWRAKKPAVRASARALPRPVQQELSLENLKVCRNDLSDSDWEVVDPPKSGARLAFLKQLASTGTPSARGHRMASGATRRI